MSAWREEFAAPRDVGHPPSRVRPTMTTVSERVSAPWPFRWSRQAERDRRPASTNRLTPHFELAPGIAPAKVYRDPKLVELLVEDMAKVLNRVRDRDGVDAPAVLARVEILWRALMINAERRIEVTEDAIKGLLRGLVDTAAILRDAIQPADAAPDTSVWMAATETWADPPEDELEDDLKGEEDDADEDEDEDGDDRAVAPEWENSNAHVRIDVCLRDRTRPGTAAFAVEAKRDRVMDLFDKINQLSEAESLNLDEEARGWESIIAHVRSFRLLFSPSRSQPLK